jgi:hypothetical protein
LAHGKANTGVDCLAIKQKVQRWCEEEAPEPHRMASETRKASEELVAGPTEAKPPGMEDGL